MKEPYSAGAAAVGLRLRQQRLKRGWSQEGLCRDICAASYLSKIEQGQVQAAPELLELLFRRLELPWYGESLPELERLVERRYGCLLDGDKEGFRDSRETFRQALDRLLSSPLAADGLVLDAMDRGRALGRGRLSGPAVEALYGRSLHMSASRMDQVKRCHFGYFMQYGLRAKDRRPAGFEAPEIGTFIHYLLENVTRDVLGQGGFAAVDNKELHRLTKQYIDQYAEQELHNFQNRTPRFRYLFNRLRTNAYAIIDQVAEELRHSDFVPMAFELGFGGKDGTLPAVTISRPDGELRVGGKVDRVDGWIKDDKLYLRVVDYKSGKKKFDLANVRMGLDIQMLLYLFALQKEGAEFFGKEIEPAGVLYLPARDEILPAERGISPEALQKEREKMLKRSGLLLEDPAVLQAMEHEALTEPHYLPLRVGKDGNLSGSLASAARLGKLGTYVDKLLGQISDELRSGNIDADPCCHSEEDSQCRFCDWVSACQFRDGRDRDRLRYILPVKPEEFWKELEEGGGDPWQS